MKISSKYPGLLLYFSIIMFLISMAFCFRAVSNIAVALMLVSGIAKNKAETGNWLNSNLRTPFFLTCCLFYFIQLTGFLLLRKSNSSFNNLQIKSALVFVPFAVCSCNFINRQVRKQLMKFFIWSLLAGVLFCMIIASKSYYTNHASSSVFFYHELLAPLKQHAILMSVLLFISLVYLLEKATQGFYLYNKPVQFFLIFCLTGCILLLSSKLVIFITLLVFTYYLVVILRSKNNSPVPFFTTVLLVLIFMLGILFTQNNVSRRFNEIMAGDIRLIEQKHFNQGVYFNGLQFRMLQFRFVKEILIEKEARFTGVATDAQSLLDQKYLSTDMYKGIDNTNDHGYLGYNTHNQFLESLLFSGIPGLAGFLLICLSLMLMAFKRKKREYSIIIFTLLAYAFTETVLETQYGIMLFTFFPLFFYFDSPVKNNGHFIESPFVKKHL